MRKYFFSLQIIVAAALIAVAVPVYSLPKSVLVRPAQRTILRYGTKGALQSSHQLPRIITRKVLTQAIYRPPLVKPIGTQVISNPIHVLLMSAENRESQMHHAPWRAKVPFPGKEKIDAVIFDMDGTLLNSLPAWENSASNFLRSQGIEPPAGLDDEMAKLSLTDGAKTIKQRYGFSYTEEEILEMTLAPILQHYVTDIQAKPGALRLLKKLHNQGIKISVATASHKEFAQIAFERLGMSPYIDFIVTCDEVGLGKQHPAVYDAAASKMGTRRERTLVVEDALHALQTARQAGYITAGIAEPFHSEGHAQAVILTGDYFIPSFVDEEILSR